MGPGGFPGGLREREEEGGPPSDGRGAGHTPTYEGGRSSTKVPEGPCWPRTFFFSEWTTQLNVKTKTIKTKQNKRTKTKLKPYTCPKEWERMSVILRQGGTSSRGQHLTSSSPESGGRVPRARLH